MLTRRYSHTFPPGTFDAPDDVTTAPGDVFYLRGGFRLQVASIDADGRVHLAVIGCSCAGFPYASACRGHQSEREKTWTRAEWQEHIRTGWVQRFTTPDSQGAPRLPGDVGAVRDLEYPHPSFDLPRASGDDFTLTGGDIEAGRKQGDLF